MTDTTTATRAPRVPLLTFTPNGVQVGAVITTPQGTFEGWVLVADGQGYTPLVLGNNPEFSQAAHAHDAVISTYLNNLITPDHRPLKVMAARLLDAVIDAAAWTYHPGYLHEVDQDIQGQLIGRGLAEPTALTDQPYGATARLTRLGWETARYHAVAGTRATRPKAPVIDEPLYPALPTYLA